MLRERRQETLKVHMRNQVLTPSGFDNGLEGQNQHFLQLHFLGKLIGGEGFTKTHFSIPEEFGNAVRFVSLGCLEVFHRFVNGVVLLRTHFEGLGSVFFIGDTRSQCDDCRQDIIHGATEPFVPIFSCIELLEAPLTKNGMYIVVCETGTIHAHCGFG